ncbi:MAG: acyl-CoA thioesterase, partial [Treponema sp.]|nr:acyl-CoA thioesterase [Treponema sp.]
AMFSITVSPRFGDIDGLGHINNTVLAVWFELARNPLFRIFTPDLNLSYETWPLIMAHTDYDFVDQLFFQYDVEIRTSISHIGTKSFTAYHEAWQEGRLCTKGHAVIVHYDFIEKRTIPIPDDKRQVLEAHLCAPDTPKMTVA